MLHATGYGDGDSLFEKLHNQAVGLIILTCAGSLPGYWTAILTIDTFGRKTLQIIGFLLLTVIFCILGFAFHHLSEGAFLALYIVGHFLFNAGPNTTTFITPGECFPTRYRATGHGLSAAMGKIGAILAQVISIPLLKGDNAENCRGIACSPNLHKLLKLFALFMFLGLLTTLLVPETKGMTLEELSGEPKTSYNADPNDEPSRSHHSSPWNPFIGGQPAGFSYPRSRPHVFRRRHHGHQRVGIMTSPELVAQNARAPPRKRTAFFRRHSRSGGNRENLRSAGSNTFATSRTGSAAGDSGSIEMTVASPADQAAPSWGAGWGRVERTGPSPALDTAQLRDVGALLT